MQLQKLLKEAPEFNVDPEKVTSSIEVESILHGSHIGSPSNKKKRKANDIVPASDHLSPRTVSVLKCNKAVVAPLTLLKTQMLDMIELIGTVKISIQLAIPRIEDGNNFGWIEVG
jgi:hypothetical protein